MCSYATQMQEAYIETKYSMPHFIILVTSDLCQKSVYIESAV